MLVACDRILVIAGDGDQASLTGVALESAGYRVSYAHRLRVATHILDTLHPDIILIAQDVWQNSRRQVIDSLRKHFSPEYEPGILVVRLAEKREDEAEADAYLPANYTETELLESVRALLRSRRLLASYRQDLSDLRRSFMDLKQKHSRLLLKNRYLSSDLSRIERDACADEINRDESRAECTRAVSELAGAVNHELNQPLTVIIGRIQLVRRGGASLAEINQALQVIEEQAKRMADIVQKIGRIHDYTTKPYPGGRAIIDIEKASS